MRRAADLSAGRRGQSRAELAFVVIIVVLISVFGAPRFRDAVERSKASEAFSFLATARTAQQRFKDRNGHYAPKIGDLELNAATPKFFLDQNRTPVGPLTQFTDTSTGGTPGWKMTLLRQASSSNYGEYSVVFTDRGFDRASSTIASDADLNGRINPLGE